MFLLKIVWDGTDHLGESTSIFTGIFPEHYGAPSGFCFDAGHCSDPPIMDDPRIEEYNLDERVRQLRPQHYGRLISMFCNMSFIACNIH